MSRHGAWTRVIGSCTHIGVHRFTKESRKGLAEEGHMLVGEGLGFAHDESFKLVVEVTGHVDGTCTPATKHVVLGEQVWASVRR